MNEKNNLIRFLSTQGLNFIFDHNFFDNIKLILIFFTVNHKHKKNKELHQ